MNVSRLLFLVLAAGLCSVTHSYAESPPARKETKQGTFVNYETQGNLRVTTPIGCVGFEALNNKLTPADLYSGLAKCLDSENYSAGSQLYVLAGVYGIFDTQRVADRTAHQAVKILQMQVFQDLLPEKQRKFREVLTKILTPGTPALVETCEAIRRIGPPDYYPGYMIQHGLEAFNGEQPNRGLVSKFDPTVVWDESLEQSVHCSKK